MKPEKFLISINAKLALANTVRWGVFSHREISHLLDEHLFIR